MASSNVWTTRDASTGELWGSPTRRRSRAVPHKRQDPVKAGGATRGEGDGAGADGGAGVGSLADALEQAIANARSGQLEQLDQDVDLDQVIRDAARGERPSGDGGRGIGTGLPTGRMPDRGVDRPPYPDEVQHAQRYANRLRQALTQVARRPTSAPRADASTGAPTHAAAPIRPPAGR